MFQTISRLKVNMRFTPWISCILAKFIQTEILTFIVSFFSFWTFNMVVDGELFFNYFVPHLGNDWSWGETIKKQQQQKKTLVQQKQIISVCRVLCHYVFKVSPWSFGALSFVPIFDNLYLENSWLHSETDQNLVLGRKYLM